MRYFLAFVFVLALAVGHAVGDGNSMDPPTYEVKRAEIAPVIDGLVSDEEWDLASPAAGDWVDLITHADDAHNTQFRMLWDADNLYILGETDWNGFGAGQDKLTEDPALDESVYNPRMFFDPNVDGEDWSSPDFNPAEPDGYMISWSMSEDFAARRPTPGNESQALRDPLDNGEILNFYIPGLRLEANVNSLPPMEITEETPGNTGGWDISEEEGENYRDTKFPGIVFSQLGINTPLDDTEEPGGVFEFAIAWSEFNATDPESGDPPFDPESPDFLENGLYHPMAPQENDVWAFEMGVRTNDPDNRSPSWSEPMGGSDGREDFADWSAPHGRLVFTVAFPEFDCDRSGAVDTGDLACMTAETRDPTLEILNLLVGDVNADGAVGFPDFLRLSANFSKPVDNYTEGDLNIDGTVGFPDFLLLSSNFGKSSGDEPVEFPEFDCDRSGAVDNGDLACMTAETRDPTLEILNLVIGDMDGDGRVGFPDFLQLSANFAKPVDNYTQGDLDINGIIGFPDFLLLSANFGKQSEQGVAASVPEPGSAVLLLLGLMVFTRRRRKSD